MDTYLVTGLGNFGEQYFRTRHNAGFDVLDILSQRYCFTMQKARCLALVGEWFFEGKKVLCAKPQTYMNCSGESIIRLMNYYDIPPQKLIVICDDVDLPVGRLRVRDKGSAGTHNGLKSLIYHIQTEDFARVRIGIGQPPEGFDMADYVLGKYPKEEQELMLQVFNKAADAVCGLLTHGVKRVQREYNGLSLGGEEKPPQD
ncbi:MAG: aminoacyl-tRNA hydrolase [Christensenellales bacterium]